MALGVFSLPGAFARNSDDHQDALLEDFPSPQDQRVRDQTPLLDVVDALDAFLAEHRIEGFVGARVVTHEHRLKIFWHGDVPREVKDFLGEFSDRGRIEIIQVPNSLEELEALTIAVLEEFPDEFVDGGPNENFDELRFTVAPEFAGDSSYDWNGMEGHLSDVTGMPVALTGGHWPRSTDISRHNDVSPYFGGATMVSGEVLCTTGFAAQKQATGQEVMISANHCDLGTEPGSDWVTEDEGRFIGRVADDGHRNEGLDTILLSGEAYDPAVYVGDPDSNVAAPVVGASRNVIGAIITNSGGLSGEIGNNEVQLVHQFVQLDTDADGENEIVGPGTWSINLDEVAQAGQGDSGGPQVRPVLVNRDDDQWALVGQNINTAIDPGFEAECSGRDEGRLCSTRAFGVDLPRILQDFQVDLQSEFEE